MNTFAWFRKLSSIALLSFAAAASTGCVAEPPEELAPGDEAFLDNAANSEALSTNWKCDLPVLGTSRCQDALVDIPGRPLAWGAPWSSSGVSIGSRTAIPTIAQPPTRASAAIAAASSRWRGKSRRTRALRASRPSSMARTP